MAVVWWMWFMLLPGVIHCYENICAQPSGRCIPTQSSTLENNPTFGAQKVIDGNIHQDQYNCSHTAPGHQTAWVEVDLRKVYPLENIKIYYRNERYWPPYRFRQYYIKVSRDASQWNRCYTDNTRSPSIPRSVQDITTCKQSARYVRIETMYDAYEDNKDHVTGAILEICEIQIYVNVVQCSPNCARSTCDTNGNCNLGCNTGYWGEKCNKNCSGNCYNKECSQSYGYCTSCNTGYYGIECKTPCPPNCLSATCDKVRGFCTNGCKKGYYGYNCQFQCDNCYSGYCERNNGYCSVCKIGYHGNKCNIPCSNNCVNKECRQADGYCSKCTDGFYGDICNSPCSPNCEHITCYRNNGTCIGGCKENWAGNKCSQCDATHYGINCLDECSINCNEQKCYNGVCSLGCNEGFYGDMCNEICSDSCPSGCNRNDGSCEGVCDVGKFGNMCEKNCSSECKNGCSRDTGLCNSCNDGKFGGTCQSDCGSGCISGCGRNDGTCTCKTGWQGTKCDECNPYFHGDLCEKECSPSCQNGTCFPNNGSCIGGCNGDFRDEQCLQAMLRSDQSSPTTTAIGAGLGAGLFVLVAIIIAGILCMRNRRRKQSQSRSTAVLFQKKDAVSSAENKLYTNIGSVSVPIEDPEEEPQIESPEEAVYYNDLSVAKDIAVSDLMKVITQKGAKKNEGFLKEFKSLPYGERFDCETAKTEENMPKNRFKTTFPYDHSRVVLEVSKDFTSDYINANYTENMEGKREFIACQGPRENTLVDHWRMIWQEHVDYIVMLTNLIEGPKVKCHQYWPDEGKELDLNQFSVTLVEEKVYAYFVERKMTVLKKRVTGSRTVVQYHYTRWPDHGTPNPLNLVVFHRHFRHKIRSSQHPIIVHCSAGIGRTGTFIALDVLSRYGKDKGKVNVIEYVKAMRKDRMTMIQNVDQYVFLYHALYEFFRRKGQYRKRDEFLSLYGDMNKTDRQKQLTNEFNELISLKPVYDAQDFKSGKKFSKLNLTKSVLPVEKYLVYLTSHVPGRECYYNAVNVSSFTRADEFMSAQLPVPGAAIDLVRLLVDHESAFLISLNPLTEVKELQSWVEGKNNNIKLDPYILSKETQTALSNEIRKTTIKITKKEENKGDHEVQIFECLNWSSNDILPTETSTLTNLIKQFSLDRKSHPQGHITVISKDGATCCGVFCAVYNAIEQLQQDDEVDIFTIVQQLQCRRPEIVSTKEEYEFCFKAVSDFLNTDSVYANT